jgi:hypothetical protein
MERPVLIIVGIACLAGAGLRAQATYPFIAELKQNYTVGNARRGTPTLSSPGHAQSLLRAQDFHRVEP